MSNIGPGTARDIFVIDVLSPFTTYVSASAPAVCSLGIGNAVSCTLPDLPLGGDVSFVITVFVNPGTPPMTHIYNTAITGSDNTDPNPGDNVDSVSRFTFEEPALAAAAAQAAGALPIALTAAQRTEATAQAAGLTALLTPGDEAALSWTDRTPVEDAYIVEARLAEGPWVPVAIVGSSTKAGMGETVRWQSKPLPPGLPYTFRVNARDSRVGPWIPLARTEEPLMAAALPSVQTACIDGQLVMEGRSKHHGAVVLVDGLPVGASERRGTFHVCGMRSGARTVAAWQSGYLPSEHAITLSADAATELPDLTLVGGDVNRDQRIDVVDLVLAGAAAGYNGHTFTLDLDGDGRVSIADARALAAQIAANPDRLRADVNGDNLINRTDLVLVGANLDKAGPTAWGMTATSVAPAMLDLMSRGASNDLRWLRAPLDTTAPDDRFSVQSTQQEDGTIAIEIVATGVRNLYAADIVLGFDPAKVRVLDAQPIVPGAQAELGTVWGEDSFQAVNDAVRARSQWRMVATRIDPAPAIEGERVLLATLRVVPIDPAAEPEDLVGAWQLQSARLLDRHARNLGASVSGSTIRVPGHDGRTIWLPIVANKESIAGR